MNHFRVMLLLEQLVSTPCFSSNRRSNVCFLQLGDCNHAVVFGIAGTEFDFHRLEMPWTAVTSSVFAIGKTPSYLEQATLLAFTSAVLAKYGFDGTDSHCLRFAVGDVLKVTHESSEGTMLASTTNFALI